MAEVGKSTIGWFFGFKLHLIINDKGLSPKAFSFYRKGHYGNQSEVIKNTINNYLLSLKLSSGL